LFKAFWSLWKAYLITAVEVEELKQIVVVDITIVFPAHRQEQRPSVDQINMRPQIMRPR
jgi:hypothetical protein